MIRKNLKQARLVRDVTQADLAKTLGIAEVTVRKIENGQLDPSAKLAVRFANYFKMELAELFPDIFLLTFDTKSIKNAEGVS